MTPSPQYLYCVGTKPLGSHHRFTARNCESKYMKFSVKFRMCLLEFFLKERERKNKHNFEALHACKKFPIFVLKVWAYPHMRARSSLHNNFPLANGTIIVWISPSKNIMLISKREREGKTGTNFEEQTAEWCYVKVSNPNLFFFFSTNQY